MGSIRRLAYGLTYGVINIPARWEYATRDAVHAAMIIKECAASESVQIEREDRLGYGLLQNVCESVMSEIEEVNTYMSGIDDAYDWVRDYREQVETWSYWIRVWNATELLGELLEDGVLHWPKGLIAETRSLSTFANR